MSNLDNLITKIVEEGDLKVQEVLQQAKEEEHKKLEKVRHEADRETKALVEKTASEAALLKERILSNAQLVIRNEKLAAKQDVMDKVIQGSLAALSSLDEATFRQYVENSLMDADLDGDETILVNKNCAAKLSDTVVDAINQSLKEKGKKSQLTLVEANITDGFILAKGGIEMNYTFDVVLNNQREELEQELSTQLFQ